MSLGSFFKLRRVERRLTQNVRHFSRRLHRIISRLKVDVRNKRPIRTVSANFFNGFTVFSISFLRNFSILKSGTGQRRCRIFGPLLNRILSNVFNMKLRPFRQTGPTLMNRNIKIKTIRQSRSRLNTVLGFSLMKITHFFCMTSKRPINTGRGINLIKIL